MSHLAQPDTVTSARNRYPRSLKGKVALVVGGAGAIGAATSRMLAEAGATIVVTHLDGERDTQAAKALIAELGSENAAYIADVANTASLIALRDAIQALYIVHFLSARRDLNYREAAREGILL